MNFNDAYEICVKKFKLHFQKLNGVLFEPPEIPSGDSFGRLLRKLSRPEVRFCKFSRILAYIYVYRPCAFALSNPK